MYTTIKGVRFTCSLGEPKVVELRVELRRYDRHDPTCDVIRVYGGVTGWESFNVGEGTITDLSKMKANGWWACAGTPGRWDALYFHSLQMARMFKEFGL